MLILDSDHRRDHVRRELDVYHRLVTPGSYILVQDGVIDVLPMFARGRPGPLPAVEAFLRDHQQFELDRPRCERFLITHHPKGWLRRRSAEEMAGRSTSDDKRVAAAAGRPAA
jgi:cephalosporin hydroxylase